MGVPITGKNGLIYVSGTEITGANEWSLDIAQDTLETPQFGDTFKKRIAIIASWAGSITAWLHQDSKVLTTAALAGISVALLIYPTKLDLTDYFSGNAIFSASLGGGVSSGVNRSATFEGDDTLTITGFA